MSIIRLNAGTASNSINSSGGVGHNVANYMWQNGAVAKVGDVYTKDTITLDNTTTTGMNGSAAASATNTISHTTGSGANRLMTVNFYGNEAGAVSTMTYNGISLTKLGSLTLSPSYPVQEIWYLIAPPTGTFNLVASMTTTSYGGFNITTWSGVDQTTPLSNYSQSTGAYSSGTASLSISAESSCLVYSSFNSWNIAITTSTNMTSRWVSAVDSWTTRGHTALAETIGPTTVSYTLSSGTSTNRWSLQAIVINARVSATNAGIINLANVSSQTYSSSLNDTTVQFYKWDNTAVNQHYNYKVMGFTSNATITFDKKTLVDYICVAGGGGGGCGGGGGGGGGITRGTVVVLPFVEYSIVVGAGGAGSTPVGSGITAVSGSNGGDTYFIEKNILSNYSSYIYTATNVALGGGGGGSTPMNGAWNSVSSGSNGGSGGGGAMGNTISGTPKYSAPGNGTYRQGFGGGRGCNGASTTGGGGGGGGASSGGGWANGSLNAVAAGGGGGQGLPLTVNTYNDATGVGTITSNQYYGSGGGGGSPATTYAGGPYGTGGTNAANGSNLAVPSNATANCGGGGGGSGDYSYAGSNGGSGVIFLRIRTNSYTDTGDGIPPT